MGQEQSGLAFRPSETEEYDPPILQDKDHKALEDRASKVLQETKKENSDQRPGPQPDRVFEGGTPGGEAKDLRITTLAGTVTRFQKHCEVAGNPWCTFLRIQPSIIGLPVAE